jgi:hypothetical protein
MANTVSILSYANTFGEWMVNTNDLAYEYNTLAVGDWQKNGGTLFLNSPGETLNVSNNAVFTGNLIVRGNIQGPAITALVDEFVSDTLAISIALG